MTTNLRDGLEALYYFGEQDFNPQRNQLQDHSGYGRHATANGSVTVGVNGPNDLEAASFSGGKMESNNIPYSGSRTLFVQFYKNSNDYSDRSTIAGAQTGVFGLETNFNQLYVSYREGGLDNRIGTQDVTGQVWYNTLAEYDANSTRLSLTLNGDVKAQNDVSIESFPDNIQIGEGFVGDIAVVCLWSRVLSTNEKRQLNSMTAPLRAQL